MQYISTTLTLGVTQNHIVVIICVKVSWNFCTFIARSSSKYGYQTVLS